MQNIHHGHGEILPSCMHPPLSDLDLRTIKWLKPDTEECDSLQKLVETKMLVNDIKRCSSHGQTIAIEGYHSLVNQFAPKMYHFSFNGMKSRLFLAAMHYNENSCRQQQQNKEGDLQYAIVFPKYKKGGHIVRKILVDCTYNYVDVLFSELITTVQEPNRGNHDIVDTPPPLCSNYVRPDKDTTVAQHAARFS